MNLPALSAIWQETAQNGASASRGFSDGELWHMVTAIAGVSSKPSACTTDYRYPSPSKRFGTFWSGPLFFWRIAPRFEQGIAENQRPKSGDSHGNLILLCLPTIKTIVGGTNQCKSNIWPWLPFSSRRSQVVWTTMSNGLVRAPLLGLLSWKLRAVACSPVRLSAQARVRCATMLAYATRLTQNNRATFRSIVYTVKKTTAGAPSRWFFVSNPQSGLTPNLNPLSTRSPCVAGEM